MLEKHELLIQNTFVCNVNFFFQFPFKFLNTRFITDKLRKD